VLRDEDTIWPCKEQREQNKCRCGLYVEDKESSKGE
jgi:ferredoxin-thioredoxin reductase catalytic subunit